MSDKEKCELLKNSIYQLYSKEGRSKNYISKLFEISRYTLADKIKEWDFPEPAFKRTILPSAEKFLNKNKTFILAELKKGSTVVDIAKKINVDRKKIYSLFKYDEELQQNYEKQKKIKEENSIKKREQLKEKSFLNYNYQAIKGEQWKPIENFEEYEISNCGRVRRYALSYKSYYLLRPYLTKQGYLSVSIRNNKEIKNVKVHRLVGLAFLKEFYNEDNCAINHKDGIKTNNNVNNLEWVSQASNNLHAARILKRQPPKHKKAFDKILYKDKYEFGTIAAFSRFLDKSETQTRRYLDEPEKYEIKLINKTNDCND